MDSSLDKLARDVEDLCIVKKGFPGVESEKLELLFRKGVYLYEYMDSQDKLKERQLPSREEFYSSLNGDTVSQEDYEHAVNVWNSFGCETLEDYTLLYMDLDVRILADVFEQFCENSLNAYKLDPAHYFTEPDWTWDALLKYTGVELELLDDIDMVIFIQRGIRGGISQCSHRYSKANNRCMSDFNESEESKYIMYFDINNFYGVSMEKPLPKWGRRWISSEELENLHLLSID